MIILRNSAGEELEIPLRMDIADDLFARLSKAMPTVGAKRLGEISAYAVLGSLVTTTEPDPRPPSAAQIKFALDIANKLQVPLPPRILQDRTIMGAFLTQYGDQVRAKPSHSPLPGQY